MLYLQNFRKAYPGQPPVLTVPELRLPAGLHWLQGVNGSGKTTLFRAVAGLIPSEGVLQLGDGSAALIQRRHPVAWRRVVNYGEAEPLYPSFLTAHELAAFVAEAKGAPAGQLATLADMLGVSAFWHQSTGTYSSGMLKKTSLVLAFLGAPRLVLLDEPLITLDAAAQHVVGELVAERYRAGVSFLLSSHQPFDSTEVPITGRWLVADHTIVAG